MKLSATSKSISRKAGELYECAEPLALKLIAKGVAIEYGATQIEQEKEVKQPKTRKK